MPTNNVKLLITGNTAEGDATYFIKIKIIISFIIFMSLGVPMQTVQIILLSPLGPAAPSFLVVFRD